MNQTITAPADRAVTVTVYEPRQTPEQDEVVLERFELKAGETREIEVASATAAYRTEPLGARIDPDRDPEPTPAQEPRDGLSPGAQEEIDAGKRRSEELHASEEKRTRAEAGVASHHAEPKRKSAKKPGK